MTLDRRLVGLAAAVPAAVLLSAVFLPAAAVAAVLIPAASIAWALPGHAGWWAAGVAPGAIAVVAVAPDGIGAYAASVLCGPVVAGARRAGRLPGRALAWGAGPLAAWTIGLAVSGANPFPEDAQAQVATFWPEGSLSPEQLAEMRASSEAALEVLRHTWVASEVVWFWLTLVAAWWFLGRLGARSGHPGQGAFSRFDLPDLWVGALIAGLAGVLAGGFVEADAWRVIGWNLVLASCCLFAVRGIAIESFWMERAGWQPRARGAALVAGFALALPVFVVAGTGLGLFDAWFDFRRLRVPEPPADGGQTPR